MSSPQSTQAQDDCAYDDGRAQDAAEHKTDDRGRPAGPYVRHAPGRSGQVFTVGPQGPVDLPLPALGRFRMRLFTGSLPISVGFGSRGSVADRRLGRTALSVSDVESRDPPLERQRVLDMRIRLRTSRGHPPLSGVLPASYDLTSIRVAEGSDRREAGGAGEGVRAEEGEGMKG